MKTVSQAPIEELPETLPRPQKSSRPGSAYDLLVVGAGPTGGDAGVVGLVSEGPGDFGPEGAGLTEDVSFPVADSSKRS